MTVVRAGQLEGLVLSAGGSAGTEMCMLEAASVLLGLPRTDRPGCVSPLLIQMGQQLSDTLDDEDRQRLIPLIPLVVGTGGDGCDGQRGWIVADWLLRTWLPGWLDLVPASRVTAARLRGLDPVGDVTGAVEAGRLASAVGSKVTELEAAARSAARPRARLTRRGREDEEARVAQVEYRVRQAVHTSWQYTWHSCRQTGVGVVRKFLPDQLWPVIDAASAAARTAAWLAAWQWAKLGGMYPAMVDSVIGLFGQVARIGPGQPVMRELVTAVRRPGGEGLARVGCGRAMSGVPNCANR